MCQSFSFACEGENQCIKLALERKDNYKSSLTYLNKAIKYNKKSEQAHYYRALLKSENGKAKSAVRDYNRLIRINPDNWIYHFNRGYLRYSLGMDYLLKAHTDFKKASELNPDLLLIKRNYEIAKSVRKHYIERYLLVGIIAAAVYNTNREPIENLNIDFWNIY